MRFGSLNECDHNKYELVQGLVPFLSTPASVSSEYKEMMKELRFIVVLLIQLGYFENLQKLKRTCAAALKKLTVNG